MSAIVRLVGTPWPSRAEGSPIHLKLGLLAGLCAIVVATPALAQTSITLSVMSDYRFRGYTLSQGRPVAALNLNHDDPSGFYVGVSPIAVLSKSEEVQFLGLQENIGYASRLKSGLTLDFGMTNANFTRHAFGARSPGYTEFYVGLLGSRVSSHVFFSPNFIGSRVTSFYAQVDGVIRPANHWRANWHVGVQVLSSGGHVYYRSGTQFDWRIGVARELGSTDAQIALTRGGSLPFPPEKRSYGRTAVVVSVRQAF